MRKEKQYLLDSIAEELKGSKAFIVASYNKIGANTTANLRNEVVKAGGELLAVKKRVFKIAAKEQNIDLSSLSLNGHIAIVMLSDAVVEGTKAICKFSKDNKESLEIVGGQFEGSLVSAEDVIAISKLPSRDEMRSQLLGLFVAPLTHTLGVVDALLTSVPHCLENKSKKES